MPASIMVIMWKRPRAWELQISGSEIRHWLCGLSSGQNNAAEVAGKNR